MGKITVYKRIKGKYTSIWSHCEIWISIQTRRIIIGTLFQNVQLTRKYVPHGIMLHFCQGIVSLVLIISEEREWFGHHITKSTFFPQKWYYEFEDKKICFSMGFSVQFSWSIRIIFVRSNTYGMWDFLVLFFLFIQCRRSLRFLIAGSWIFHQRQGLMLSLDQMQSAPLQKTPEDCSLTSKGGGSLPAMTNLHCLILSLISSTEWRKSWNSDSFMLIYRPPCLLMYIITSSFRCVMVKVIVLGLVKWNLCEKSLGSLVSPPPHRYSQLPLLT